jgi:hypothetical protein
MEKTFAVLNGLEERGVILRYAIGGAVGALYYMQPFETEDLDVLCILPTEQLRSLAPLSKLYQTLREMGYVESGPFVMIEGIPVQFLPAYSSLVSEAVEVAGWKDYLDTRVRILSAEHLLAIMVATGRDKDRMRLRSMLRETAIDSEGLMAILAANLLTERFEQWTSTS